MTRNEAAPLIDGLFRQQVAAQAKRVSDQLDQMIAGRKMLNQAIALAERRLQAFDVLTRLYEEPDPFNPPTDAAVATESAVQPTEESPPAEAAKEGAGEATLDASEAPAPIEPTSPSNRDESAGGKASPGAGPQAKAPLAGTGTGTPADREGHSREGAATGSNRKPNRKPEPRAAAAKLPPLRARPVTKWLPPGRDPLLKRPAEAVPAPVLHEGSQAQQLADAIGDALPALMGQHPQGVPTNVLAMLFNASPTRVRDAVLHLSKTKRGRIRTFPSDPVSYLVPVDFEPAERA